MASKSEIAQYAREWLGWYPEASEADLREALKLRFLNQATPSALAAGGTEGSLIAAHGGPEGCLAIIAIGPLLWIWHTLFPRRPTNPADLEAVLATFRAEGRWAFNTEHS